MKMIGGQTEGFICTLCHHLSEETEGRISSSGMICENCDPEPTLQKPVKKTNNLQSLNVLANASKENSPKAIQILNTEELNSQIIIPSELNIIDCPTDKNPDKYWFKKQFRNLWRLFNNDSEWVFVIHDRGTCKSKNDAIIILYNIAKYSKFQASFIMREWEAPVRQSKEYFKNLIQEFSEVIWQGEKNLKNKNQWNLLWSSTYKGISYKKDVNDKVGILRNHFFSLFDSDAPRSLINEPISMAIFDECIPTRDKIKQGKGWKLDEAGKYMDLMKSLGRNASLQNSKGEVYGNKPQKIFTGNPNDSWRNCWMLTAHFTEELKFLEKWYWSSRPKNFNDWLKWEWTKELQKGNKTLQLKKIVRQKEDFPTFEDDNWDNFFQKPEDLRIVEHKNSADPLWVFNDCLLYSQQNKQSNYFYFIDLKSKAISSRDRELITNLPEYCINSELRMRSKQRIKRDRTPEEMRAKLLRWYESKRLFFADMTAKTLMEEFLAKKRTWSEF
jgi:hypothetical protein